MNECVKQSSYIGDEKSIASPMRVGVHQGSVSPLLFILVLEALSTEFKSGAPWQLFYADDLVFIAESVDKLIDKQSVWKKDFGDKGM